MYKISKLIELDAAHRVPDHQSKCRHVHGHRYKIEAHCEAGSLGADGPERGMVMDFGFLKDEMLTTIHNPCDHRLILWADDALFPVLYPGDVSAWRDVRDAVDRAGFLEVELRTGLAYLINDGPPTAEMLARHWFRRLAPAIISRTKGRAKLTKLDVWETPTSRARHVIDLEPRR